MWNGEIGRAFSPFGRVDVLSRDVAPVWYRVGPLALAGEVSRLSEGQTANGPPLFPFHPWGVASVWYRVGPLALADE